MYPYSLYSRIKSRATIIYSNPAAFMELELEKVSRQCHPQIRETFFHVKSTLHNNRAKTLSDGAIKKR